LEFRPRCEAVGSKRIGKEQGQAFRGNRKLTAEQEELKKLKARCKAPKFINDKNLYF